MNKVFFFIISLVSVQTIKSQDTLKNNRKENINIFQKDTSGNTSTSSLLSFGDGTPIDANTAPVIMPSPNSMAITNLISENVDLYTGKTNVNLPLYTLKSGSISLPISLQTNVNAHRVNDIGSWCGLGWNLNAGGVITRVMKNLPDEFAGNTISAAYQMPGWGYLNIKGNGQNVDLSVFDSPNPDINVLKNIIAKGNWNVKSNWPDRGWDLQPDEFFFNFGNYSGKFVFDQDGGVNLIPQSNLKITPLFQIINGINKITGFTVLTEDGFKYEFGNTVGGDYSQAAVEETKMTVQNSSMLYTYRAVAVKSSTNQVVEAGGIALPYIYSGKYYFVYERFPYLIGAVPGHSCNVPGNNPILAGCFEEFGEASTEETTEYFQYPSSWMLKKITSPGGDFLNFNYSSGTTVSYQNDRSFSASVPTLVDYELRFQLNSDGSLIFSPNTGNKRMPVFLSPVSPNWDPYRRIFTFPAKQNFTVSKTMIELKSKKLLSISTSENNTIDFASNTPREDFIGDNRLDFIAIKDRNNNTIKKINFNYNIKNTTEIESANEQFNYRVYPSRYYFSGGAFVSMASYFSFSDIIDMPPVYLNKTWEVLPEFRKRMFLSSVQEEANGVNLPAYGFNYGSGKLPYRTSTEQDLFGYANSNPTRHPFANDGDPSQRLIYRHIFPYSPPTYGLGISPVPGPGFVVRPILFFNTVTASGNNSPLYGGNRSASPTQMLSGVLNKITYPTGGYKEFEFEFSGNSIAWNGLRVKQIREYESATATAITKNYTYGSFINTDGVLSSEYNYPTHNHTMGEAGDINALNFYYAFTRKFFSSSRVNPESSTRGAAGGYSFAEVSQPNNGKYHVEFFTAIDFPDNINLTNNVSCFFSPTVGPILQNFPFPAKSSQDWKRGFPKSETISNQAGLTVKYDEYIYHPNPAAYGQKEIPSIITSKYKLWALNPYSTPNCTEQITSHWLANLYGKSIYTSAWYPIIKKISRIYEQNGSNYSESIQEYDYRKYTYNNKDYLFQYQQKDLKNSRNEQTVSYSKYPFDYTSTNASDPFLAGIQNLKTQNVFNAKVEQFSFLQDQNGNNKRYIGGILTKYQSSLPMVNEIFKLKTNGLLNSFAESSAPLGTFNYDPHYNSEVQFLLYDANGRILEQNKTNDIKETYIWDYSKMYPVAKAVNANQNEIAFSSFEADEAGSNFTFNLANIINNPTTAFTGKKYLLLTDNSVVSTNINVPGKEYKLTYWYKSDQSFAKPIIINNTTTITPFPNPIKSRAGWSYCEYTVPASFTGSLSISKNAFGVNVYLDEVRFYPAQSQMNTYTFDPLIGMTNETDVNGKTVYYEYDALNRLSVVRNEDKDIVKTICYNYAGQTVPCPVNICAAPVINSIVRNGFDATIDFTAPVGSTGCSVKVTDIFAGTSYIQSIGCNSPVTIQLPSKMFAYKIEIISYSSGCPNGTYSLPWNI